MRSSYDRSSYSTSTKNNQRKRFLLGTSLRRFFYSIPLVARKKRTNNSEDVERGVITEVCDGSLADVNLAEVSETNITYNAEIELRKRDSKMFPKEENTGEGFTIECPICRFDLPPQDFPSVSTCNHRSCYNCFQRYLRIEILESRVKISCPECSKPMHPNDVRMILNDKVLFEKYEDFMVRRVLANDPYTRWCPKPDCGYGVIAAECENCPKIKCERSGCNSYFCYHCRAEWHPNQACDAVKAQNSPKFCFSSINFSQHREDIKSCPRCHAPVMKISDGSCNHMTCSVCGTEYCWLCMRETDPFHFISPSGCTLWGKKRWSRKKKMLWQIGTLTCAPLAIVILAGIAAPAMIIGIPILVGRKLYVRYKSAKRYKRNLIIASGVISSVMISPILTGLAIGIGAPILLFYAYGVMPISLWRSGNLGMLTTSAGTIYEFSNENSRIGVLSSDYGYKMSMNGSEGHLDQFVKETEIVFAGNNVLYKANIAESADLGIVSTNQEVEVQVHMSSTKQFGTNFEAVSERSDLFDYDIATSCALSSCRSNIKTDYTSSDTVSQINVKMAELIPLSYDINLFIIGYIITLYICILVYYLYHI